jgi:hypothetical protein
MRGPKRDWALDVRNPLQEMMDRRVNPGNDDIVDNSPDIEG